MSAPSSRRVLLVTGLKREARIIGGPQATVLVGGGCGGRLAQDLERAAAQGKAAILSIGIAGGLMPGLAPGTVVVAAAVIAGQQRLATSMAWTDNLKRALPQAVAGDIAGVDRMIAGVAEKAVLRQATGAVAVDMESHIAARVADHYAIPFAALRIVADPAERALPPAAQAGMGPDGRIDMPGVIRSLMTAPAQIPALVRTGLDAEKAFRALARCRRLVGPGFGLADFAELPLDMP